MLTHVFCIVDLEYISVYFRFHNGTVVSINFDYSLRVFAHLNAFLPVAVEL